MYYKLVSQDLITHKGFQWEVGKWYRIPDEDRDSKLCTSGFFHCYDSPYLAAWLNFTHANIMNPRLFEVSVKGRRKVGDDKKFGFTMMRLNREIPVPTIFVDDVINILIECFDKAILAVQKLKDYTRLLRLKFVVNVVKDTRDMRIRSGAPAGEVFPVTYPTSGFILERHYEYTYALGMCILLLVDVTRVVHNYMKRKR